MYLNKVPVRIAIMRCLTTLISRINHYTEVKININLQYDSNKANKATFN